jgi:hypothetical protein
VAQFRVRVVWNCDVWCYGTYMGGGAFGPPTVRYLAHNHRSELKFEQIFEGFKGKKIFSNSKVIKKFHSILWIFLSTQKFEWFTKHVMCRLSDSPNQKAFSQILFFHFSIPLSHTKSLFYVFLKLNDIVPQKLITTRQTKLVSKSSEYSIFERKINKNYSTMGKRQSCSWFSNTRSWWQTLYKFNIVTATASLSPI